MSISKCHFTVKKQVFIGYAKLMKPIFNRLHFPTPEVIANNQALVDMVEQLGLKGIKRPVIITDSVFSTLPAFQLLLDVFELTDIEYTVFDEVEPDPDFLVIDKGIKACKAHQFDAVIAIGGGSSIDAAKVINTCAFNNVKAREVVGMFKIKHKYP
jgi:alcohol dehydrogenase class IV